MTAKRVIGPGAGIIFKGSGFYETDYRSSAYKKAAEADRTAQKKSQESSESKSSSDSKSSSGSDSKSKSSSSD